MAQKKINLVKYTANKPLPKGWAKEVVYDKKGEPIRVPGRRK